MVSGITLGGSQGTGGRVLQLPFLSSPYFRDEGRVLINGAMERAGITQIKHIVNRTGVIDIGKVVGILKEKKEKFRKDTINKCIVKIMGCLKKEWRDILKMNVDNDVDDDDDDEVQGDDVEILLCLRAKTTNICHTKTKDIYQALIQSRF